MKDKRTVDMQVISEWVEPGARVLDLGCGRGVLLEYLKRKLEVQEVGVDLDLEKGKSCVKRGLSVYMGDMMDFMKSFPDKHFDYVICSRTVQELKDPQFIIQEALRVSRHFLVGFVNFGYWRNRLSMLFDGRRIRNEVFPNEWWESRPTNPLSVNQFEAFCVRAASKFGARYVCAATGRSARGVSPTGSVDTRSTIFPRPEISVWSRARGPRIASSRPSARHSRKNVKKAGVASAWT